MRLVAVLSWCLSLLGVNWPAVLHDSRLLQEEEDNGGRLRNAVQIPFENLPKGSDGIDLPALEPGTACSQATTVFSTTTAYVVLHGRLPEITIGNPLVATSSNTQDTLSGPLSTSYATVIRTTQPTITTTLPLVDPTSTITTPSTSISWGNPSTSVAPATTTHVAYNATAIVGCWDGGYCASTYEALNKCYAQVPRILNANDSAESNEFQDCFCNLVVVNQV